jgi:hypothetical protein
MNGMATVPGRVEDVLSLGPLGKCTPIGNDDKRLGCLAATLPRSLLVLEVRLLDRLLVENPGQVQVRRVHPIRPKEVVACVSQARHAYSPRGYSEFTACTDPEPESGPRHAPGLRVVSTDNSTVGNHVVLGMAWVRDRENRVVCRKTALIVV